MAVTARAEHVGSLLRPSELLDARRRRAEGAITPTEFKAVEDAAVRHVVALQEEVSFPLLTDGELRRESFQSSLADSVTGFAGVSIDAWLWGAWHSNDVGDFTLERPADLAVVERLSQERSLASEEFVFLRSATTRPSKVTLPSPSLFASMWSPEASAGAYRRLDDFMADVVEILSREVRELERLGCTYVQLDAPHYPLLLDPGWKEFYEPRGWEAGRWLGYGVELDNAVISAGSSAMTFGFHLCRGNQASRWLVAGGYEPIAREVFAKVRAGRLLLEYDDERSGGFEPLALVRDDCRVVLGVVTTKTGSLEDLEGLLGRVEEAAKLVGKERLAVGTQCGFSTSVLGNALSEEDERAKLALLVRLAEEAFGEVA